MKASDYPYLDKKNSNCFYSSLKADKAKVVSRASWKPSDNLSVAQIVQRLESGGPFVTYVDGFTTMFMGYKTGILNNPCCFGGRVNHGVVTVGYGITGNSNGYWIIRNHWGTSWGDAGYMRLSMVNGGPGICGNQLYGDQLTMMGY